MSNITSALNIINGFLKYNNLNSGIQTLFLRLYLCITYGHVCVLNEVLKYGAIKYYKGAWF